MKDYDSIQYFCINNDTENDNVTYTSLRNFYNKKGVKKVEKSYQEGDDLDQSCTIESSKRLYEFTANYVDKKKPYYMI